MAIVYPGLRTEEMASESDGDGRTTGRGSGDDDDDDCKKTWDDVCQEAIRLGEKLVVRRIASKSFGKWPTYARRSSPFAIDASDDIGEPITVRSHLLPFKFKLDGKKKGPPHKIATSNQKRRTKD